MWEFVHTEVVDAPCEDVFRLLADLSAYPEWNPFVVAATGDLAPGGIVKGKAFVGIATPSFRHRIFDCTPNRSLCWKDFGPAALLVCGERSRHLEPLNGKTKYTCHLKLSGPLAGLVNVIFGQGLRDGIVAEAKAISERLAKRAQ